MVTSVLGKRSRKSDVCEDVIELRSSKRRTRSAAPAIFEDERCTSTETPKTCSNAQPSVPTRSNRSKRRRCEEPQNASDAALLQGEGDSQTCPTEDLMDIENIPPTILNTPTTVRFKDVLHAKSSTTPKHRVKLIGSLLTPKSSRKGQSSPRTQNAFSAARQLFNQSTHPAKLIGRDVERKQIRDYISHALQSRQGGCTYISGPPGTGKSALVQDIFREFEHDEAVEISTINCVSLRTANDVFGKLLRDFAPSATIGKSSLKQYLSKLFLDKSTGRLRVVLLDEIDSLLDTDCEVLYTIFEWAMRKSSSIVLFGIANALDLTDRFLPRLKARGLQPNILPFLPYTAVQISTIISDKLRSLVSKDATVSKDFVPFMQPMAIQLCGKKIASQTGDLRKAFSLVRRIIDQLEQEATDRKAESSPSKKPLGEISNTVCTPPTPTSSPPRFEFKSPVAFTAESAPRATIAHVARIASSIFNNGTLSRLSGLNLQQKAVLCSLVAGEKRKMERNPYITPSKSSNKVPSVKELFIKYCMLCTRDEGLLQPLKDTEFRDVVASLETLGLVHEHKGRTSSLLTPTHTPSRAGRNSDDKQVVSAVSEKEMRESLSGAGMDLLQRLLDNE